MRGKDINENNIRNSRFPPSLFFVYFIVLLLMSGMHTGLLVGMDLAGTGNSSCRQVYSSYPWHGKIRKRGF